MGPHKAAGPRPASAHWSGPAGRGRVVERVIAYEPLRGQALEVDDDSISGRQSVAFAGAGERVQVSLTLDYKLCVHIAAGRRAGHLARGLTWIYLVRRRDHSMQREMVESEIRRPASPS